MRRIWPWLALLIQSRLVAAEELDHSLVVATPKAELDDGVMTAQGPVSVRFGKHSLEGEGLRFWPDSGRLWIQRGTWTFEEQSLRFEEAEFEVGSNVGTLLRAALQAGPQGVSIEAGQLIRQPNGELSASDVAILPCTCDTQLWSLRASEATIALNDEVSFQGGWIEICERKVLPIPRGKLPLTDRQSGVLIPEMAWGKDGPQISVPTFWTLGSHADVVVEPEVRWQRGARVITEGRVGLDSTGPLMINTSAGYDWIEESWRGHGSLNGGIARGRFEGAVDALWMSDSDLRIDYEDDYQLRAEPWIEQRAMLSLGAFRMESALASSDGLQRIVGGVISAPGRRLGEFALSHALRVDWFVTRQDDVLQTPRLRGQGYSAVARGGTVGPIRFEGKAQADAVAWQGAEPWAQIAGGGAIWMQTWGRAGPFTRLDEWGVVASWARPTDEALVLHPWDQRAPRWTLGPALQNRWITASGVPVSIHLSVPWTPDGWIPQGIMRMQQGAWMLRLQGQHEYQEVAVDRHDSDWRLGTGLVHADAMWQGRGWLASPPFGPADRMRVGWNGLVDIKNGIPLSQGPSFQLSSPCDCLDLEIQAIWTQDRVRPDISLQLELL